MSQKMDKKGTILLLVTIFAVSINLRPAITSIGPMLEIIRDDLSLTNTQVTLLTGIPIICMGIFATLSPILNRRFGLIRTMYAMLIVIGITTLLRGLISGFIILIITAFIIGVAIAIIGPLLSSMIKQYFPNHTASVIGLYSFGMGVGSATSAGITGVFYQSTGSYLFALSIWSSLAFFGLFMWMLASKKNLAVQQKVTVDVVQKKPVSPWKSKKAWLFLLFFGFQSSLFFSVVTWLAPIALASGMSLIKAGSLLGVTTIVQTILNLGLPLLMNKYPARVFWITAMLISGMVATGLLWTGNESLMWVGAFFMGVPLGGLFPAALLLPLDETETADETNSWTAMMQTGGFIIGGLLPLIIALVYDQTSDHKYTFIIFMSLFILLFILTFFIGNKKSVNA